MTDRKTMAEGQRTQQSKQQSNQPPQQQAASGLSGEQGLHHRYGSIGIDAVAAACRYSNSGKKAEPAAVLRIDQRFEQAN